MTLHKFHSDSGKPLDAHFEVEKGQLILHSRGGTKGTKNARNTEYGPALRILLARIEQFNLKLFGVWVDSSRVQELPMDERKIYSSEDTHVSPTDLFTELSNRMAQTGRGKNVRSKRGNSNKRLRFTFDGNLSDELIARIAGWCGINKETPARSSNELLNSDDREWIEGHPKIKIHLRRERAPGLVLAKKVRFIQENGRLLCERCGLDPVKSYGPVAGDACIEVHHKVPLAHIPSKQHTKLEDLECLCANCHRVAHYKLRNTN